jgi:hypothetical protein
MSSQLQQLERDPYQAPAFIAAPSCIECKGPCLPTEQTCARCRFVEEDIQAEHE